MSLSQWLKTGKVQTRSPSLAGLPDPADSQTPREADTVQVTTKGIHSVASRVLSCFCSGDCTCYNPVETCLVKQSAQNNISNMPLPAAEEHGVEEIVSDSTLPTSDQNSLLQKVTVVDESLMGRHCVVEYDKAPYPGIILDVDEDDVEVRVMNKIGVNRFFWPLLEDRLWYHKNKVVTMLDEEPQKVTNRHCQIDPSVWQAIVVKMDLD